jgi:hypothetical protein
MRRIPIVSAILASVVALSACGGKEQVSADAAQPSTPAVPSSAFGESQTPDPGGKINTFEMMTDDQVNNNFVPN